jgi:glucosamine--fructose-6-phosphate aminotransferase (isomerizing)
MMAVQLSADSIAKAPRRAEIIAGLHEIPAQIKTVLALDKSLQQLATTFAKEKSLLIMGRGYQFATCLEAALKIKEVSPDGLRE